MPGSIVVRPVTPTDLTQWELLWEGYNTFYKRALPARITRTLWARLFDENEPVHAFVAEKDARLVGLVHYLFHRSTSMIELNCYLQDLFTEDAVRGQGIGRALIEAVYERAKVESCSRVYWQTHQTNNTAMKLYDKVAENTGFVVYRKLLL